LVRHCFGQKRLARAGRAVKDDTLGWLDAHLFVQLRVQQGKLHRLADFLDLLFQAANVRVRLGGGLVELHDADEGVRVIRENADDTDALVVKEDARAGLQEILVDETHDANIVLGTRGARNNGMVVVDHLLQCPDPHGAAAHVVNAAPLVGQFVDGVQVGVGSRAVLGRLGLAETLLVLDVFLLQEQVVVDALHAEQAQLASAGREDGRQLRGGARPGRLSLLATDPGGGPWRRFVLGLVLLHPQARG